MIKHTISICIPIALNIFLENLDCVDCMLNFSQFIDLPMVWLIIMIVAIFFYVVLDGFDLGVGILMPFAPSESCKDKMVNSIAPFWDGNETWLVLSGGVLFIAFPVAYSIVMPALYLPVTIMLIALVLRGVSFEFRAKSSINSKRNWNFIFHISSLLAAFFQGVIVGALMEGIEVNGREFSGDMFVWLSAFSMVTGFAIIFGYVLLGATWLILKTEGITQDWARRCAKYSMIYVPSLMGIISIWVPFIDEDLYARWFASDNVLYLIPVPILTIIITVFLYRSIVNNGEIAPFVYSIVIFSLGFLGFGISLWPWAVPRSITIWDAAASNESLSLMLIGVVILLPIVLFYTGYSYYVFKGKSEKGDLY